MTFGFPISELDGGPRAIAPELLLQELASERAPIVVDVRSVDEFRGRGGRIASSRSIPMHQMIARRQELFEHRSDPIVVVSNRGFRARLAAFALVLSGFEDVATLEGGLDRWRKLGHPTEVGSSAFHSAS